MGHRLIDNASKLQLILKSFFASFKPTPLIYSFHLPRKHRNVPSFYLLLLGNWIASFRAKVDGKFTATCFPGSIFSCETFVFFNWKRFSRKFPQKRFWCLVKQSLLMPAAAPTPGWLKTCVFVHFFMQKNLQHDTTSSWFSDACLVFRGVSVKRWSKNLLQNTSFLNATIFFLFSETGHFSWKCWLFVKAAPKKKTSSPVASLPAAAC